MPPKAARLNSSHFCASSFSGPALVTSAMFSSWRPSDWRSKRATWAAKGKPICSGVTGWVIIERLTRRLFSTSRLRNWVGVGCQGGEIRLGGGDHLFDILVQAELVVFSRQQIVGATVEHEVADGLGLGVQRVQRNPPAG